MENQSQVRILLVQVRDQRPTHTQNARTIFAQTRVEKRVLKHAFARIWTHFLRVFPFVIHPTAFFSFFSQQKARQKAVLTNTTENISTDKKTADTF